MPGCARDDCCSQRPPDDTDDLETTARRVVTEMLETQIEAPRPGGNFLVRASQLGTAINVALRAALEDRRLVGDEVPAWPFSGLRVLNHPDSTRDHEWVDRYRVIREPQRTTVLEFALGGGLCVVTNRHGSWIVHSPALPRPPADAAVQGRND